MPTTVDLLKIVFFVFSYIVTIVLEIYFVVWTIKNVSKNKRENEDLKNKIERISNDNENYRKKIDLLENKVNFLEWKNGKTPE